MATKGYEQQRNAYRETGSRLQIVSRTAPVAGLLAGVWVALLTVKIVDSLSDNGSALIIIALGVIGSFVAHNLAVMYAHDCIRNAEYELAYAAFKGINVAPHGKRNLRKTDINTVEGDFRFVLIIETGRVFCVVNGKTFDDGLEAYKAALASI